MTPLQESKENINLQTQRGHKNLKKLTLNYLQK